MLLPLWFGNFLPVPVRYEEFLIEIARRKLHFFVEEGQGREAKGGRFYSLAQKRHCRLQPLTQALAPPKMMIDGESSNADEWANPIAKCRED